MRGGDRRHRAMVARHAAGRLIRSEHAHAAMADSTATEMLQEIDAAGLEEALRLVPMRRHGKPGEIAAAMVFLASDQAAYITGQTLRVNGGMSMA